MCAMCLYRTICIPCTKETNGALKLSDSEGTCQKHGEVSTLLYQPQAVCMLRANIEILWHKYNEANIFLHTFVTEELIMGPDLVSANFTSEMKDGSPKYIRSITIKQRGLVMIHHIPK